MLRSLKEHIKNPLLWYSPIALNENLYFSVYNRIFEYSIVDASIKELTIVGSKADRFQGGILLDDSRIVFSPFDYKCPVIFDIESDTVKDMVGTPEDYSMKYYQSIARWNNKLFFMPFYMPGVDKRYIMMFNSKDGSWHSLIQCMEELEGNAKQTREAMVSCAAVNDSLWIVSYFSNRVLVIDCETMDFNFVSLDDEKGGFSSILYYMGFVWLSDAATGDIVKCNPRDNSYEHIAMPKEYSVYNNPNNVFCANRELLGVKDSVVTIPGYSNSIVRINTQTNDSRIVGGDFFCDINKNNGFYAPGRCVAATFAMEYEQMVMVQRAYDGTIGLIDLNGDWEKMPLELPGEVCDEIWSDFTREIRIDIAQQEDYFHRLDQFVERINGL